MQQSIYQSQWTWFYTNEIWGYDRDHEDLYHENELKFLKNGQN